MITLQKTKEPLEKIAEAYISEEKGVESAKDAISGACDIMQKAFQMRQFTEPGSGETTMRKGKGYFSGERTRRQSLFTRCIMSSRKRLRSLPDTESLH